MQQTFEYLLGLPAAAAVALLAASGICDVEVVPTAAPPRGRAPHARSGGAVGAEDVSALRGSPGDASAQGGAASPESRRTEAGEREGYASTRVVAVQEDGRRLIVSRFLTGTPQRDERSKP